MQHVTTIQGPRAVTKMSVQLQGRSRARWTPARTACGFGVHIFKVQPPHTKKAPLPPDLQRRCKVTHVTRYTDTNYWFFSVRKLLEIVRARPDACWGSTGASLFSFQCAPLPSLHCFNNNRSKRGGRRRAGFSIVMLYIHGTSHFAHLEVDRHYFRSLHI